MASYDAVVTSGAEKPSDFEGLVVVIDSKLDREFVLVLLADGAAAILLVEQLLILL